MAQIGIAASIGSYNVGIVNLTFVDIARCASYPQCSLGLEYQLRFGKRFDVAVYVPQGKSTPSSAIVFAYEYPDQVTILSQAIASAGIIVAAFPVYDLNHRLDFAKDLLFVGNELVYETASPVSPLWNSIATNQLCLMGQGQAGSAPILTFSQELLQNGIRLNVSGIIALSPTMQNDLGLQEAALYALSPALVFGASNDCVHPTLSNAVPAYNAIRPTPGTCKTYIEILNATSCSVTDAYQSSCLSDEIACGVQSMISATAQRSIMASLIASWVSGVVGQQQSERSNFVSQLRRQTSSTLAFLQSCPSLNSSHIMSLSKAKNI